MNNLNSILIEGNVVRAPNLRYSPKGIPVCVVSIAVNRWYPGADGTFVQDVSFFDVEAWSTLAEKCMASCDKGRGLRVVGRLKQDRWRNPDGRPYSRVKIVAEHIELKPRFTRTAGQNASEARREQAELADVAEGAAAAYQETQPAPVF
ncbi:MAG TPA: single-stranded DNA-binding protein [Candidatus Treponema faecavium]|nr:single-stranded DNA-binding protein [Candidatus Treponema faecavium]